MASPPVGGSERFGPIELAPGVGRGHAVAFCYAAFMTVGLLVFVAVGTPYVLNAILRVPTEAQGRISGDLAFWTEVTLLVVFSPVGVLADRIGRPPVYALGFVIMAAGYALYPLASSVDQLVVYRIVYAVGIGAASGMLATVLSDYPRERSRGKLVALTGTLNGLGIVAITLVFGALPRQLVARGWDPVQAGQATHLAVAALCLLSALVALAGLKRGLPVRREDRPSLRELFTTGFSQARNPRVALAYACAFVARGDMVVLGTFTALWGTTAAVNRGVAAAEAVARGRMLIVIAQVAALAAAPLLGMMMDRINRVTGVAICMALAAIGYGSMVLVGDPLAPASWLWFALLGIGQIAAFFAAMTLLGQEAPAAGRGATTGMFNIAGALGILFCTGVGGRLFDGVGPRSPFLMLAGFNALLVLLALVVRRRSPGPR